MARGKRVLKIAYDESAFKEAIQAVLERKMTQREASKRYGIPQATLSDRLRGRRKGMPKKGPSTILSISQEKSIKLWMKDLICCGFEVGKPEVLHAVKTMLDSDGVSAPFFKDNLPGDSWWYGFLSRHNDIALPNSSTRCPHEEQRIINWFLQYRYILERENIKNPISIYILYEIGFSIKATTGTLDVKNFANACRNLTNTSGKCQITAALCLRGDGAVVPPYIIFPGNDLKPSFGTGLPPESRCYSTEFGEIRKDSFHDWFKRSFLHSLGPKSSRSKVVLILESYSPHRDFHTSMLAKENDVILLGLPFHSYSVPQKFDDLFLKFFKSNWKESCHNFLMENESSLNESTFGCVFQNAFETSFQPNLILKSFENSGIWPLAQNVSSVPQGFEPPYGYFDEEDDGMSLDELLQIKVGKMASQDALFDDSIGPANASTANFAVDLKASNSPSQSHIAHTEISDEEMVLNLTPVETSSQQFLPSGMEDVGAAAHSNPGYSQSLNMRSPCGKALVAIEATMSLKDKTLFEKRFEIEQLTNDGLYAAWKHLKLELIKEQGYTLGTTRRVIPPGADSTNGISVGGKSQSRKRSAPKSKKSVLFSNTGSEAVRTPRRGKPRKSKSANILVKMSTLNGPPSPENCSEFELCISKKSKKQKTELRRSNTSESSAKSGINYLKIKKARK